MAEHSEAVPVLPMSMEPTPAGMIVTGITGLDQVLGGGIPAGSLILIIGAPGTGKTLLSQQLCFNRAKQGQRAIYFSTLSEPHSKLVRQLQSFSFFDPQLFGDTGTLLALQDFLKQGLEATAEVIVRTAREQRASVVCVDGFRAIEAISQNDFESRSMQPENLDTQLEEMAAAKRQLMELRQQVRSVRDSLPR